MLTDLIVDAFLWIIGAALDLFDFVMPAALMDLVTSAMAGLSSLMAFTPVSSFLLLFGVWAALDLIVHAYIFAVSMYRLVPFKAS